MLVAEIRELQIELEALGGAQEPHGFLQIVALFTGDAHRVLLNRGLYLDFRVFHDLDYLLGLFGLDAFFELDQQTHGAARAFARLLSVEVLQADLALDQLLFQHHEGCLGAIDGVGQDNDAVIVLFERRLGKASRTIGRYHATTAYQSKSCERDWEPG